MNQFIEGDSHSTMLEDKELLEDTDTPGNVNMTYSFVYLGRDSLDGTTLACVYIYYEAEIRFNLTYTLSGTPFLWGLVQSTENEEAFRVFFKFKALDSLLHNGVIKKINYVQ